MGGKGSGSWYRWQKKQTVENSRFIDANRWMREGILKTGSLASGNWLWVNPQTNETIAAISYQVNAISPTYKWVRLSYSLTRTGEYLDYRIELSTTTPNYGGLRWWFICPLVKNNVPCKRRVGKLYLPIGERYYGCRTCYKLTYRSCQESDKKARWLRKHPEELRAMLDRNKEG